MSVLLALITAALPVNADSWRAVDARLEGKNPSSCLTRFTGYEANGHADRFVENTNFWLKGIDFSCVSPWNSAGGRQRAGTLISKRHIVFAKHFPFWQGVRIVFVGEDGGVCPCYIEATKAIEKTDIMIGLLNAEVTPNIIPAKLLSKSAAKRIGSGAGLPVVTFNQHEQAFLTELNPINTNQFFSISSRIPSKDLYRQFRAKIIVGDSGNPAFLLLDGKPVLVYCLHGGGCGSGPPLHLYRREIQAAMDELAPGYRLTDCD